jgi:5-bromo-4-chloroindolyl phosphate hydrolysis protein
MIAVTLIAATVFVVGPVLFSLIVAGIIVLPMYLAVQLFGDKD